jgi:iron complex outermembrane receptor protein
MRSAAPMRHRKLVLLLGACALSYSSVGAARAQGAPAERDTSLEEVVVTAQRRSERLVDVPISITSVSANQLERAGVSGLLDLTIMVPGLKVDRQGGNTQPAIRGVTTLIADTGSDSNVAIYIDGVYQPNQRANNFDLPDIERIEVAKGPQGTLFGRNATGGAIQIFTKAPSFTPTGRFELGGGSYHDIYGKAYVSGPVIADRVAVSLTGFFEKMDGYYHDLRKGGAHVGKLDSDLVRGKILLTPTDDLKITLIGTWLYRNDTSAGMLQPLNGNSQGRLVNPNGLFPTTPYETAVDGAITDSETRSAMLKVEYDLGFGTLASTTSYADTNVHSLTDPDFSSVSVVTYDIRQPSKTFMQEVNFASLKDGPFSWIGGLFYYHSDARYAPLAIPQSRVAIRAQQVAKAWAAFGEATYDVTDRLSVIGGVRYSREQHRLGGSFVVPSYPAIARHTWDAWTPRVALRYEIAKNTNAYASYSKGFKSGGFSTGSLNANPYNPESITAYEVGIKSRPSGAVQLNAAAFYYDYKNQQVQSAIKVNGVDLGVTNNAAAAEIYGVDFDAAWQLTPEFAVNAGLSIMDASYKSYKAALVNVPRVQAAGVDCRCGNVTAVVDASGNPMIRAPDWTLTLSANYRKVFELGTLGLNGTLYHTDNYFITPDKRVQQPSYTMFNAQASWRPRGSHLEFTVYGKNLTDKAVFSSVFVNGLGDGVAYAAPRTFGGSVGYAF